MAKDYKDFGNILHLNPHMTRGFGVRIGSAHMPKPKSQSQLIRAGYKKHRFEKEFIDRNILFVKAGSKPKSRISNRVHELDDDYFKVV